MSTPKNIHLIFLHPDEPIPGLFKECEELIRNMHPAWNIVRWDEETALQFLKDRLPEYVKAYTSFPHNVQRADFLRLALVYCLGGFYMDMDMYPMQPLDELVTLPLVLAEEKTLSEEARKALNLKYSIRIANYMFGGEDGHPFLRRVMDHMAARATLDITTQQQILDITGPGLLTDTYWDNRDAYPDIVLLRNEGLCVKRPDGHWETNLFGAYAVHLHAGTWRKDIDNNLESNR